MVVVALVAGASTARALALGTSMALLQFSIGTLNDIVDAPRDRVRRPGKPIASGRVSLAAARAVLVVCVALGLSLALLSGGPGLLLLALVGLGIGAWYDLAAKGTGLSWLPVALGIPLLPVFAWYGAAGSLPWPFAVLVPMAALAGAALAIANQVVDIERDSASGVASLAVALGSSRATLVALVLELVVAMLAVASASRLGATGTWLTATAATAVVPVAGALLGVAAARRGPGGREAAFEIQAIGLALLAVAWVNAVSAATHV